MLLLSPLRARCPRFCRKSDFMKLKPGDAHGDDDVMVVMTVLMVVVMVALVVAVAAVADMYSDTSHLI